MSTILHNVPKELKGQEVAIHDILFRSAGGSAIIGVECTQVLKGRDERVGLVEELLFAALEEAQSTKMPCAA